jgi:hypothetical protein
MVSQEFQGEFVRENVVGNLNIVYVSPQVSKIYIAHIFSYKMHVYSNMLRIKIFCLLL